MGRLSRNWDAGAEGYTQGLHSPRFDFDEEIPVRGTAHGAHPVLKLLTGLEAQEQRP